jgi:fimbrial isopeptide formation D2 family protein
LKDFCPEIGLEISESGEKVSLKKGECLRVCRCENTIEIEYAQKSEIFRALTYLPTFDGKEICEKARYSFLSYMADVSRNAVLNIPSAKRMMRMLAGMGYNSMMLYMEKEGKTNGASLQPYKNLELGTFNGVDGYGKTDVPNGYYLVRNTKVPSNDPNAHYSDYIVKVVGEDILVEPKDATTTTQKKVQDQNTSESSDYSDEQDSADFCIGDTVPYTLTAQLPLNYERYEAVGYRLMFEDDMDKGLDWDGKATIYLGPEDTDGTEVQFVKFTGNTVKIGTEEETLRSAYDGGTVWMLDIANMYTFKEQNKPDIALNPGDTIVVKYNATLNSQALIGETGNRNRHRVIFSNNPTDRTSLGATPYDMNAVFTYKVTLNKVLFDKENNKNEPLQGADFKLEKWEEASQRWIDVTQLHGETGVNPAKTGDVNGHVFTFSGLDDGKYRLTEIATPEGYNTLPIQEFEIKAEHPEADDNPTLESLEGTEAHDFSLAADVTNATLSADIVNRPGVVLPASGSIGATIIQIAGAVLLAGAVTIGIMKRRARNA